MFDRIRNFEPTEEQAQKAANAIIWTQDWFGAVLVVVVPLSLGLAAYLFAK